MARYRYQTGSVRLRGKVNPVWEARFREDVIRSDGSTARVRRGVILGTKKELPTARLARRRLEVLLSRINDPGYRPGRMASVAEFAERWKVDVLAHRKPSTVRASSSHLECHILPMLGSLRLDQLGVEVYQGFVTALSGKKVSRKTISNILGTLSTMVNTAKAWGYVCQPVKMSAVTLPEPEPCEVRRFFTPEQARSILWAAKQPYLSMFALAALAGLRAGEIMGLRREDLDLSARLIHVRQSAWHGKIQTVKTKSSARPVVMADSLAVILEDYLGTVWKPNPAGLLFVNHRGRPFNQYKVVASVLNPLCNKLKIPKLGLHAFRHLHSSLLLRSGAAPTVVRDQLRHADARITLGVYGHVIGDDQREAVEHAAQLLDALGRDVEGSSEQIQ